MEVPQDVAQVLFVLVAIQASHRSAAVLCHVGEIGRVDQRRKLPQHRRPAGGRARSRGARKLSLRVLGGNVAARRLYEACGFTVEGVLREEFFLGGRYVDDVLMACLLDAVAGPGG